MNMFNKEHNDRKEFVKPKAGYEKFAAGAVLGFIVSCLIFTAVFGGRYMISHLTDNGFASADISEKDVQKKLDKLGSLIDKYYLYEDEYDKEQLIDGIYSGYISALGDPYSKYYNEEETDKLYESNAGEFTGIGAAVSKNSETGMIDVAKVYAGTPAEKAGLKDGDILYQVDGKDVSDESIDTVISWLRGEKGSDVVLGIIRDGEKLDITVTLDTVDSQTVTYEMKENKIGYLRISEFDAVTYGQYKDAFYSLEDQGMEGLVIDLRNNPGGNLDTVTDILKLILPEGVIVSTKDKYGNVEEITCDGENEFTKPLAVLVNQKSASASEIFSAAVQDYGAGTIVGMTTYGKGVVQQIVDLGDGTCVKLTIAEYFTPDGRSINGNGVIPDIEVEYEYDENNPYADSQLDRAIEIVNGKIKEKTE